MGETAGVHVVAARVITVHERERGQVVEPPVAKWESPHSNLEGLEDSLMRDCSQCENHRWREALDLSSKVHAAALNLCSGGLICRGKTLDCIGDSAVSQLQAVVDTKRLRLA